MESGKASIQGHEKNDTLEGNLFFCLFSLSCKWSSLKGCKKQNHEKSLKIRCGFNIKGLINMFIQIKIFFH